MKTYIFNYFTGYGYREISAHTIEIYPIRVKAETLEEAIKKCKKKASNLSRYNNCFNSEGRIQVFEEENKKSRVGVLWLEDEVVKWEGEIVYHTPVAFGKVYLSPFSLPNVEDHYGSWIKNFCCNSLTYSYVGWMKYSIDRFDYTKFWSTASKEEQERDYKKYVVDEIDYLLKSNHCPKEDKEELKKLKLIEN